MVRRECLFLVEMAGVKLVGGHLSKTNHAMSIGRKSRNLG